MNIIKNLDEYKILIKKTKEKGKIILNNNFLYGQELIRLIANESLSYHETEYGLTMYQQNDMLGRIEIILQVIDLENHKIFIKEGNEYFLKYLLRNNKDVEKLIDWYMWNNDFLIVSKSFEMSLIPENSNRAIYKLKDISISPLPEKDKKKFYHIIENNLNLEVNPISSTEDFVRNYSGYHAIYHKDILIGGFKLIETETRIRLEHFVIKKTYQSKGIGAMSIGWIINSFKSKTINLWVENDNLPAISLYEKFGFTNTGKISVQYKKETYL